MQQTQYHLLKTKRFLPLFATQFSNAFNDNVFKNAFVILIAYKLAQTPRSAEYMIALTNGIFILPFFLFSATAGQIADKFQKAFLIRIIKFIEIIFMLIASYGFYSNNFFLLMATLFFLGTHSTFFGPLKYSILPEQLRTDELIGGNGLIEAGTFIAILLGQILGGTLILMSAGALKVAVALLSIATFGFTMSLFIPKTSIGQPNLVVSFNLFRETWHIMKIANEKRELLLAIIGISWFWFVGATFLTQFPTFTKEVLASTAPIFTLFLTIFSLGIGVGSLLCNRILKGKITAKYVPIAMILMSLFILDLFVATHSLAISNKPLYTLYTFFTSWLHVRILIDIFLLTVCSGLYIVPLYAILQDKSDDAKRSRVIAANNIINALLMALSALYIISFTALDFTTPEMFLIVGIINLFIAALLKGI